MTAMTAMIENAIALIHGTSVLDAGNLSRLDQLAPELRQTWDTAQIFRTRTEMEISVLDDIHHPTPDAKYWQCVREQNVMFGELVGLSFEYRKNIAELKIEQRKLEDERDPLQRDLIQIEIERKTYLAATMERVARDRMREIEQWSEIKAELLPKMKHGTEDVNAHQAEAFPIRFQAQAALCNQNTSASEAINLIGLHVTAQRVKQAISMVGV